MRKKLVMTLLVVLIFAVTGCGNKNKDESEGDEESGAVKVEEVGVMEVPGSGADEADTTDEAETDMENGVAAFLRLPICYGFFPKAFVHLTARKGYMYPENIPRIVLRLLM